ncbi:alpha/beta hydrolase fold domain-containing protein, partial [bacterium]|nr:alpha/beta hydrolase fold domain-containing protein [bacterium]
RGVIVFFFGGGWTSGGVGAFTRQAEYFASRGLVAARADYRVKSREGVTPDKCVEDARSAVRWVRANADRLGIDPLRLITSGGSAGGHLAACATIVESVDAEDDDLSISTIPQAMVLFNPVLDLTKASMAKRLSGDKELARKISPTLHLDKNTPPAVIFFGSEDRLKVHGDEYWQKAESLGVRADRFIAEGEGHGFFNRSPWLERTIIVADKFLASLGFLEGEPTMDAPTGKAVQAQGRQNKQEVRQRNQRAEQAKRQAEQFFRQNDRDKDGKLSRAEFPEHLRQLFDLVDANKDGVITLQENIAFRAARVRRQRRDRPTIPTPDFANVKYGTHERNVFDLWLAKSDSPTPLVIYYHGGGFRGGDKRSVNTTLLKKLVESGVSVAAVNYRLSGVAPFPAQMHDCARALQFIRHHAAKYNLDPKRVGATGGSAGAGISMWLAFHNNLADLSSSDPVARESTRLTAAVVYAAQSSYDPRFIKKLFNTNQVESALIPFFGMAEPSDVNNAKFHPLFEEASPINHATSDDAPVMLFYPQANTPLPPNSDGRQHIHHPKFGFALKEKLDKLGVECVLKLREQYPGGAPVEEYAKFFFDKFGMTSKQ